MANPATRQELIDYCMRQLGAPVLEINLDEDQANDRLDEALQYFQEYHSDATVRTYAKHQVVSQDITNGYITLPDEFVFVTRVLPFSSTGSSSTGMWSVQYQLMMQDFFDIYSSGEILSYEMSMQYLNTLDMLLNGSPTSRWSRKQNRIYIDTKWGTKIVVGDWLVVEGRVLLDPEDVTKIYNDLWLKRYTTALFKRNWGQNLIKFEGIQMPGGVTLNGRQLYDDAQAEIEKLELDIESRYQLPVDFMVG